MWLYRFLRKKRVISAFRIFVIPFFCTVINSNSPPKLQLRKTKSVIVASPSVVAIVTEWRITPSVCCTAGVFLYGNIKTGNSAKLLMRTTERKGACVCWDVKVITAWQSRRCLPSYSRFLAGRRPYGAVLLSTALMQCHVH